MLRILSLLAALVSVTACTTPNKGGASPEEVSRAIFRHDGPPKLTLYTMLNNDTGAGAHSSILINGSQRVAFDPAGSFRKEGIVSHDDVVYGMTPYMVDVYTRFHARKTYHVVVQELEVSPQVAEMALQKALAYGPVSQAQCAYATSDLLSQLPGFGDIGRTYFPKRLIDDFAAKGATIQRLYEYDDDDKTKVLRNFVPEDYAAMKRAGG
ncbi:hypothetical protein [Salinihabitans flavidus]|nr:hypothetical protein [Salinihabitans flavidus]